MRFRDRDEAGLLLADALASYKGRVDLVLALPRGGVPVAYHVAQALGAPLDVLTVRKLGVPWEPEVALGALGSGGTVVLNERVLREIHLSQAELERLVAREQLELERRESVYRGTRPFPSVTGKTVMVVDDGLATGSTMEAALEVLRRRRARRLVVAVPVAPRETLARLRADEVVCLQTPDQFTAVGAYYSRFEQVADEDVRRLLALAA